MQLGTRRRVLFSIVGAFVICSCSWLGYEVHKEMNDDEMPEGGNVLVLCTQRFKNQCSGDVHINCTVFKSTPRDSKERYDASLFGYLWWHIELDLAAGGTVQFEKKVIAGRWQMLLTAEQTTNMTSKPPCGFYSYSSLPISDARPTIVTIVISRNSLSISC